MSRFLIVGAGPVGTETATALLEAGHEVAVLTRSGSRPVLDGVRRIAADASDADALTEAAMGSAAIVNCANPGDYTTWSEVWPPLAESLLTAAERTGATLVTAAALYPYGPVDTPMVEGMPDRATDRKGVIRAGMWAEAKARHDAGRIRAVEVRASDYVGTGVGPNGHITRQLPTAVRGKAAWVVGDPDLPHTWTDVHDMGRTLAAVAVRPETWGQIWHAPSQPPRTQRQVLTEVLAAADLPPVALHTMPKPLLGLVGLVQPLVREINESGYMFRRSYVMDSARSQRELGLAPSPWADTCRRTAQGNPGL
ncbi:MAG TPA: NAD-dependent epimerase/dehydratase family protein [Propionibacteriaceae bacterium]